MTAVVIVGIIIIILLGAVLWRLSSVGGGSFVQKEIQDLRRTVDEKLGQSHDIVASSVEKQFKESQKLIQNITKELEGVKKTNEQVFSITESLGNLEKVLKHQKQRGNLGERGLKLILENILPPNAFSTQFSFDDGTAVDAVIHTKNGIIPIDAKFSLDNYNRAIAEEDEEKKEQYEHEFRKDLKKRIDETAKYIREKDGTLPFALMYIPAEGIYYDLLVGSVGANARARDLIEYAYKDKKVIIVSPTTFVAYLHTILQGFRAFQIEERAKEIEENVRKLGRHIATYEDAHGRLGKSLSTTVNHYNRSRKELGKMDKDVMKISGDSAEIEEILLDRPEGE
ncbi:MAG: DNA recombination protein RmuC [Candidatus Paceibacterota bacterium]